MTRCINEYRINKKRAECYRTRNEEEAKHKLQGLSAKRPGVYSAEYRTVPVDRYGLPLRDGAGNILWSCWNKWGIKQD